MYFVYSLLLTLGFILLLPRFALDAFKSGKYVTGLRERLGAVPKIKVNGKNVIWLHCVSVGEARAGQTLVRSLSRLPGVVLVVSTTTVTGQKVAREIFRDQAAAVFYFPIDWAWTVRRVLRRIQPVGILVMETEIWPHLFREARKLQIPIALLNGRISERSFRRYRFVRAFIARVLDDLTLAVMQTDEDAARIRQLGMPSSRLEVAGNLKFDSASVQIAERVTNEVRIRFNLDRQRPLIVAASTHDPEEAVLLKAFGQIRKQHPTARLLLAPRHPERFNEVAAVLAESELSFARRADKPSPDDVAADIILLDSIGELGAVYPLADVAFVGGSIIPHGGQSVIEPAARGVCTVTGPYTQNFAAVTQALIDAGGLIQLGESTEPAGQIAETICQLLADDEDRRKIGDRARAVCEENKGATDRTLELISNIVTNRPPPGDPEVSLSPLHATAAK